MFRHIGRKLAIFNTLIVIILIIVIGFLTYTVLRRSLQQEIDQALEDRISAISSGSEDDNATGLPIAVDNDDEDEEDEEDEHEEEEDEDDEDEDDEEHREDREIVSSGDTVLLLTDSDGQIVGNPRDIKLADIPVMAGVERALAGDEDVRSVELSDDTHMRVMTVPLLNDGRIVGTVQALRNLDEHEEQLEIVQNMTILGVALGIVVAGPVGYFLSRRAMVPINTAFERQRVFVADASHELRTPLTLIRAHAEYAARRPERTVAEVQPSLDGITGEVDRISTMVTDLLTLARLDAGKLELERASHDLAAIAQHAVAGMQPIAEQTGVALVVEHGTEVRAEVDPARIEQVVRILLDNSLRHTPPGGQIVVAVASAGTSPQISVRDTGSGIAADELPHVFDRFSRQDSARDREQGGVGLGLAIAKALVEQHRGTITVASEPGEGTTVTMQLPERVT